MDNIELTAIFPIEKSEDFVMSSLKKIGGVMESIKWKKTIYTVHVNFSIDMPKLPGEEGRVEKKIVEIANTVDELGGGWKEIVFVVKKVLVIS